MRTLDPWISRMRAAAERRSPDAAFWLGAVVDYPIDEIRPITAACESPIEAWMLVGLLVVSLERGWCPFVVDPGGGVFRVVEFGGPRLAIRPQQPIGGWRPDFLVEAGGHRLVVECDGREWHEDREHDARRDAELLQQHGLSIVRYTGREIWADALACAAHALGPFAVEQ